MLSTLLQLLCVGAVLSAAAGAAAGRTALSAAAESRAAQAAKGGEREAQRSSLAGDLSSDESGRLFDLGLGSVYSGYGTKYQPDTGSYGTYGTHQPGYAGQGVSGYGLQSGYGGYNTLSGLQPCYSGFGTSGVGYNSFQPSYSPIGPNYYPTNAYPGTYSSSYPSTLGGVGTDFRGYKGYGGHSSSYVPYSTRYGA